MSGDRRTGTSGSYSARRSGWGWFLSQHSLDLFPEPAVQRRPELVCGNVPPRHVTGVLKHLAAQGSAPVRLHTTIEGSHHLVGGTGNPRCCLPPDTHRPDPPVASACSRKKIAWSGTPCVTVQRSSQGSPQKNRLQVGSGWTA